MVSSIRSMGVAAVFAFATSCATAPPPRPARLDPANASAPESRPLETTTTPSLAPGAEPPAAKDAGGSQ